MGVFDLLDKTSRDHVVGHSGFFSGRLLVAMPRLDGSLFGRTVIFICHHDAEGAMGIIVNQPISDVNFTDILKDIDNVGKRQKPFKLPKSDFFLPVYFGGPVDKERGFILHSRETVYENTEFFGTLAISGTVDILYDIMSGAGPQNHIFVLGYAGWGAGQLEEEYQEDSWMLLPYHSELIFSTRNAQKWQNAFSTLGIDPSQLAGDIGHG